MRLFLSSYRLTPTTPALTAMVGAGAKAAVVLNALDCLPAGARAERVVEETAALAALGLGAEELDLRAFSDRPGELRRTLAEFALVWATGGNAFVLRDAMRRSGFDTALAERLSDDSLVYGGYSAGACVAGPTLRGLELVDDPGAVAELTWDGLKLVDFSIAPHYDSDHSESALVERVVSYFREHAMPHRVLRDGESLVVENGQVALVGNRSHGRSADW